MPVLDPWGSTLVEDYARLVREFGLEPFDPKGFPEPNRLMRRGVVFAGRDLKRLAHALHEEKPFYALTGIMPSAEKIHLGTKMVVENLAYFQKHGGKTFILVADLEAAAARGIPLQEARDRALRFHIPAYLALGLDPKKTTFYFQSQNMAVVRIGFEASQKITLNEFKGVYGSAEPGRIMSAVTQIGDMLYPQLEKPMVGVIPVGVDQDPHVRLCRDYLKKDSSHKNLVPISAVYNKFTPSLDGGLKMSKSKPESCVELPEDAKSFAKKIKNALTGGRDTLVEHRRLGAVIEKDMVFELLKQHLVEDDEELEHIREDYASGKMLSGEIKQIAIDLLTEFMEDFSAKLDENRHLVNELHWVRPE